MAHMRALEKTLEGPGASDRRSAERLVAFEEASSSLADLARWLPDRKSLPLPDPLSETAKRKAALLARMRERRAGRHTYPSPFEGATFEVIAARAEPVVDDLVQSLQSLLSRRRRAAAARPVSEGGELHLETLMRVDQDPGAWASAFRAPTMRERLDASVLLLVDLSGSMRGDRVRAAQEGVVLLVEALRKMGVPFSVQGFQDVLVPLLPFGADASELLPTVVGDIDREVQGNRVGGHNQPGWNDDGPCLLEAAKLLETRREEHRLLIVLSDGEPAGRRSKGSDLRHAISKLTRPESGITLVGLGLGPGTAHVERYYGEAGLPEIELEALPEQLGSVLAAFLAR